MVYLWFICLVAACGGLHFNAKKWELWIVVRTQYRPVGSGSSAFSRNLLKIVHFGLGGAEEVESVQVRWRDGTTELISEPGVNTILKAGTRVQS